MRFRPEVGKTSPGVSIGVQNNRVLLVAAGVTFYALLALFPATAAIVSLYGLFADAAIINEHLGLVSGFMPAGALEVIGDQVKRIASQGQAALGLVQSPSCLWPLPVSLWCRWRSSSWVFQRDLGRLS
jgi:membrane protein